MRKIVFPIVVFTLLISACSSFQPLPTVTPTFTATLTPLPSVTITPVATPTPEPTATPTPMAAVTQPTKMPSAVRALLPQGKAVSEWEGFPIMPNAIAGKEKKSAAFAIYSFTVKGSISSVQNYYIEQLPRIGWIFVEARDGGDLGNRILEFHKGVEKINISILLIDETERIMMVMIVKENQ